jgi:hypothetical protein
MSINNEVLFHFNDNTTSDLLVSLVAKNLSLHKGHYSFDPENLCFTVLFNGDRSVNEFLEIIIAVDNKATFVKYGILIYRDVPDNKVAAVVELLTRFNNVFKKGVFKFDYETRICEFEHTIHRMDQPITDQLLYKQIVFLFEHYVFFLDAFKSVILDGQKPLLVYHTLLEKSTNAK